LPLPALESQMGEGVDLAAEQMLLFTRLHFRHHDQKDRKSLRIMRIVLLMLLSWTEFPECLNFGTFLPLRRNTLR
jgi:hypothetical protein